MLRARLAISALLIPAFIGLCWLDARTGPLALLIMPLALLIAFQCIRELAILLHMAPGARAGATAGALIILVTHWIAHLALARQSNLPGSLQILVPLAAALLAYAVVTQGLLFIRSVRFLQPGPHTPRLGSELFCVSYIGVFLTTAAALRWIGNGDLGYLALGSLVIGAKIGDVGGYTFGRLFGKTKLSPLLSPGKTRAGAVGAVLTAAIGTALWLKFAGPLFQPNAVVGSWPHLLLFGALLGITGLIGDLAESLLKRDTGHKDASNLMPGFGGLLDLVDSILYAAPLALILWLLWPPVA